MPIPVIDKFISGFGGPILDRNLVENILIEITADTIINSANVETYNRKILWSQHITGTFDITIEENLDFDYFDISVTKAGNLRFVTNGLDRINGEGDYRFTEFEGGRLQKVTNNIFVLVHEDATSAMAIMTEVISHTATGTQNYGGEFARKVHILASTITGFDALIGSSFEENGIFTVVNLSTSEVEFDISAVPETFGGDASGGDVQAYNLPASATTMFYINGTIVYPLANTGGGVVSGAHPLTVTRDTPSLSTLANLAAASTNGNSALWVLASDQIAANENGVDPSIMIRALEGGILDANGDEISTTAVQKSTIVLNGGTIVRIFSNIDLRVVSAPSTVAQTMRYPDIPFTGALTLTNEGLYNSYLSRTATNAGGSNQYIRMPSLHTVDRPSWLRAGDVFVMRHTGTTTGSQRPHFRPANVGDSIAGHGLQYFANPGETIAIQAPAVGIRTWQLFPVSQRSDGTSYYNPEGISEFYIDELETLATRNPLSLYNRHTVNEGLVRDHIRAASFSANPISLAFQRKNYQDSIAWIQWWSVFAAVPPLGTIAEEILDNIPTSLAWIETNINNGYDFEFNAPDVNITIPAITNDGGNSFRIELASALPSYLAVNDTITIAGATNIGNNGNFLIDSIAGDRLLFNITNASGVNESGSGAFTQKTIYCDAVLVSHDLKQTNFNCYEDSARTDPATINPNWFDPSYEGVDSVLAIGYNTDVLTIPPAIRMEDDNGDFFLSLGGPRGSSFFFDNRTSYQNLRYLPLNYEDIHIDTLGTTDFFFDIHPEDLPVNQRRRFNVFSDPINDNDDVTVGVGRSGQVIISDEGLNSVSILNGTSQEIEIYNTGDDRNGWRIVKPFEKYMPSASLINVITPAEGPISMTVFDIVSAENQDPNFSFTTFVDNKAVLKGRFRYILTMRIKLRFDGAEDTGLSFVNVSLVPTRERGGVTTDITREVGNSTAKIDFVRNGNDANDNTKPIYTLTGQLFYVAEPNDEIGWELRFGDFPAGYSVSDLRQIERQYTVTVRGGIN